MHFCTGSARHASAYSVSIKQRAISQNRPLADSGDFFWTQPPPQQYSPLLWKLYMPAIGKLRPALGSTGIDLADSSSKLKPTRKDKYRQLHRVLDK
jgi:hypothetical protein